MNLSFGGGWGAGYSKQSNPLYSLRLFHSCRAFLFFNLFHCLFPGLARASGNLPVLICNPLEIFRTWLSVTFVCVHVCVYVILSGKLPSFSDVISGSWVTNVLVRSTSDPGWRPDTNKDWWTKQIRETVKLMWAYRMTDNGKQSLRKRVCKGSILQSPGRCPYFM